MKASWVVASFVGLVGRCAGVDWPVDPPWPGPDHDQDASLPPPAAEDDAGVDDTLCAPPGLYADCSCKRLNKGVIPYTPSYELWSDGADKERFIYLPEGSRIDTQHAERWQFPVGTRLYKTFSLDGKKLETRVFVKTEDVAAYDSWTHVSYAWSADQRSVELVTEEGRPNVLDTEHDIPSQAQCRRCHEQAERDIVNGFDPIQLNHQGSGWTLQRLIAFDRLVNSTGEPNVTLRNARIPGSRVDREALGYLHANCGNCHSTVNPRAGLDLSLTVGLSEPSDATAYAALCKPLVNWTGKVNEELGEPYVFVAQPGAAAVSGMIGRMAARDPEAPRKPNQMPPIASEIRDDHGLRVVSKWIDAQRGECEPPPPPPPPAPMP
jgi:hypothetical protein